MTTLALKLIVKLAKSVVLTILIRIKREDIKVTKEGI